MPVKKVAAKKAARKPASPTPKKSSLEARVTALESVVAKLLKKIRKARRLRKKAK